VDFVCKSCGDSEYGNYEYSHANELLNSEHCNDCYKWYARLRRGGNIIIEGCLYVESQDDGRPHQEVNLNGDYQILQLEMIDVVPELWKDRFPDNAEFV
jgi:hypothetical protein